MFKYFRRPCITQVFIMCRKLSKAQKAAILDNIEGKVEDLNIKLEHLLNGGNPARQAKKAATKK